MKYPLDLYMSDNEMAIYINKKLVAKGLMSDWGFETIDFFIVNLKVKVNLGVVSPSVQDNWPETDDFEVLS